MTVIIRDEQGREVKVNNEEHISAQLNIHSYKFTVVKELLNVQPDSDVSHEEYQCEIVPGKQFVNLEFVWENLKNESWWRGAVQERMITAVMNSRCYSVYLYKGNDDEKPQQVGFARVVTDYATFAYIDDVVIDPEYRGLGIGSQLNRAIMEDPDLQTFRRWFLIACDKVEKLYENVGFKRLHNPDIFMEIYNGDAYVNDEEIMKAMRNDKI